MLTFCIVEFRIYGFTDGWMAYRCIKGFFYCIINLLNMFETQNAKNRFLVKKKRSTIKNSMQLIKNRKCLKSLHRI